MTTAQAQRDRTPAVAVVAFAVLVLATVGAFFVTQRLKRSNAVVKKVSLPVYISPNGDGRKDSIELSFLLPKSDRVTVSIVDGVGDEVRRLADDESLPRGVHRFRWTGRDSSGSVPPDGTYYLRVALRDEGRATTAPRGVQLVTKPPRPKLVSVTPSRLAPGAGGRVTIKFSGPSNPAPLFSVYRVDPARPRLVSRFPGVVGSGSGQWDGRDRRGRPVPAGSYAFAVTVQNKALVAGSAPRRLPPTAATAAPHTGLTVAGPRAAASLEPVRAGSVTRVAVTGTRGRLRYRVVRLGSSRPLRRGIGRAPTLHFAIPRRAPTGLYAVRVRSRAGRAAAPLVIQGRPPARARPSRVLVVLPAIAWQGLNPVDDDADGFPDTLASGATSVALERPFAFGRLPAPLRRESAPLLTVLDQRYDLTTDLALARGFGPRLDGHRGVLFAGSELWLTEQLDGALRSFVEHGGRIASFGTDAFRRTVRLTPARVTDPSRPQDANVFGEQTAPASSAAAPLVVFTDPLGLFSGSDGFVGLFTRFEQQQALVRGAKVVSAAGRDQKHPAFVAYRLGRGLVIRAGTPQWARAAASDTEVAAVTRSTWDLLSR